MNEAALMRFARSMLGAPFEWGRTDCILLVFRALDAGAGCATAARYWEAWRDRRQALRRMRRELPSGVLKSLGLVPVNPALVSTGDIVLAPARPFPEAGHVVLGRSALSASPVDGVCLVSTSDLVRVATSAWRAR